MSVLKGIGVGLRHQHYGYILRERPAVAWFEVLAENYLDAGPPLNKLQLIGQHYPLTLHGVGLSIGSTDQLDRHYLQQVKRLIDLLQPLSVSDHLCWTGINGFHSHELLPLPYTDEALQHVVSRVHQIQDFWQRPLMLENISRYIDFAGDYTECEFLNELAKATDCNILLDVNNVWVNACNIGINPMEYILALNPKSVKQIHLGGYEQFDDCLIDTHGAAVYPEVWQLYQAALRRFGNLPTCIEWDNQVPEFNTLLAEAKRAEELAKEEMSCA